MPGRSTATHPTLMLLSRVLSFLSVVLVALIGLALPGCGHNYPPAPKLPEPVVNQQVGPGDVLEVLVVGEEKLPHEYEVGPDGTLAFPYVAPLKVAGLEPRQ